MNKYNWLLSTIFSVMILVSCNSHVLDPDSQSGDTETKQYSDITVNFERFGGDVSDLSVTQGEQIAVMFSRSECPLEPYSEKTINALKVGAERNVVLVNPSKDGRFLGFDGSLEIKNHMTLSDMNPAEEFANQNLAQITEMVESLCDNSDFLFFLEKTKEGFTIRHKASNLAFTDKEESTGTSCSCIWSMNAGPIVFSDASEVMNSFNLVKGNKCQLYIKNEDMLFYSGRTSGDNRWFEYNPNKTNGNANWLIYDIPVKSYVYSAMSSGKDDITFNGLAYNKKYDHYVIYPYSSTSGFEDGKVNFHIPRAKNYVKGGIDKDGCFCLGKLDTQNGKATLSNVCGVLEIPIKGSQRVLSIEITDLSGNYLWGDVKVDAKTKQYESITGGSSTSSIDCYICGGVGLDVKTATNFMTVMPATSLKKGLAVRILAIEGEVLKEFGPTEINSGQITKLPEIELSAGDFAVPTISIENEIVAEYMANVNYGSYENTVFSSECHSFFQSDYLSRVVEILDNKIYRTDFPSYFGVSWSPETGEGSHILLKSKDSNMYIRDTTVAETVNTFLFWNLLPDRHYVYSVSSNSGSILQEGEFKTKGCLRMIYADGSWNIRDMGGMLSREYGNRPIRYEQLYRGGSLNEIGPDASTELKSIGIKAELDLRGSVDPQDGQLVGESANLKDWNTCAPGYSMIEGADYRQIMTDYVISAKYHQDPPLYSTALVKDLAWIIYELKKETPHPVYYHCKLGADRTNAVAYSIEGLLGCSIGDMARDYELTSFGYAKTGIINRYVTGNESFHKTIMKNLKVPSGCNSLGQRLYYYFNQHFEEAHISSSDLDWFIEYMLGMSDTEFKQYKSAWTWNTKTWPTTLEQIFTAPTVN